MERENIAVWSFVAETKVPATVQNLLIEGEVPYKAFKTLRDVAIFTNKRLIVSDSQGVRGKKREMYSVPYASVDMWSTENAGTLDWSSEVELWTRAGVIKIKLGRQIDVRQMDRLLSEVCL